MARYPVALDLTDRTALVVGVGRVGSRKLWGLLEAGAKVLAIDPQGWLASESLPAKVELRAEPYRAEHLEGVVFAIASATPEVNRQVVADAQSRGIWVNSASHPDEGDVILPAVWRDGPITLSVSTEGASPVLAKVLRDRAAKTVGPTAAYLAKIMAESREFILATVDDADTRRHFLSKLAEPEWIDHWKSKASEDSKDSQTDFNAIW